MAFRDGAGSGTFKPFSFSAGGVTNQYSVMNSLPTSGQRIPSLAVPLTVDVDNSAGGNSDVQFQVARDVAFTDIAWSTTQTNLPNGLQTVIVSGLVNLTKYWWRSRAAPTGTTTWGPWSGQPVNTIPYTPVVPSTATANSALDPATNALDGNVATHWHSGGEMPTWWRAQFSSAQVFNRITIRNRNYNSNRDPRDFLLQGSNDGTAWTTLATKTAITWSPADELKTFDFTNTTAYLYARIYITANNGDNYVNIAEVTFAVAGSPTVTIDPWTFTPDLNSGRAFGYVESNLGVFLVQEPDVTSVEYVNLNFGVYLVQERDVTSAEYVNLNHGVEITLDPDGVEYVHYGDVNTLTPTPHIWFLKPKSGRPGDGIRIFCFGVGDLQATFSGVVEAYWGPVIGWVAVPVITWQTYGPTAAAYTALRQLDELAEIIDMQHTVIEITVPLTALPPGMPVRIKTNGA
jgi:hypothetical protein